MPQSRNCCHSCSRLAPPNCRRTAWSGCSRTTTPTGAIITAPIRHSSSSNNTMYLSDRDIKKAVRDGAITIQGFDESRLQPASYDILLGNKFIVNNEYQTGCIDPVNRVL